MSTTGIGSARPMTPIGWLGLPMLACVAGTLLLATPVRPFGVSLPQPIFPLAAAFAWAQIRPSVLPPFALLALGLFLDVFWGGPQGLWPLCLLTAYAAVLFGRRLITGQDVIVVAAWYAGATLLAIGVGVGLMILATGATPNLIAVGWMYVLPTLLLFPFAHRLVQRYDDADVRFR
jgi:rod shape-determining protein MreD